MGVGWGGGELLRHLQQPQLPSTKVCVCERSGRAMSVLVATQLTIDTSFPSRRVRRRFGMQGTLWGNVCADGQSLLFFTGWVG